VSVEQRFVFDEIADLYDRVRPAYPETLIDDVIALAGVGPDARLLEIGCGTGQATEAFARRGLRIVCLEPGAALARRARERLARFGGVDVLPYTLEAWPLDASAFDLVVVAQAFHWLRADLRFAKTADALRPGGALAVFGNSPVLERTPLRIELDRAYALQAPAIRKPILTRWYADDLSMRTLFRESRRFGPVESRSHPWAKTYPVDEYLDLLRTHSDHRLLAEADRERLIGAVRDAIERHGGAITVRYDANLYVAHVSQPLG